MPGRPFILPAHQPSRLRTTGMAVMTTTGPAALLRDIGLALVAVPRTPRVPASAVQPAESVQLTVTGVRSLGQDQGLPPVRPRALNV
jgi:hypothetical protein